MSVEVLQVRLDEHARRLTEIERTKPAVLASEVAAIKEDVKDLREDMRAQTKALYLAALSVAGGALTLAFTAFRIWGG